MKNVVFVTVLTLVIGLGLTMAKPTNLTATPTAYEDIGDYQEKAVSLMVDQGTLIKLSTPVSSVFVADPSIADVQVQTPRLVYVYGRTPGSTNLYAVDEKENVLMNRQVSVRFETARLSSAINQMLPTGKVSVRSLNNTVVLRGEVQTASDAADAVSFAQRFVGSDNTVVNQLKIKGANQINLQVTIAEMSRNSLKDLGINWNATSNVGNFVFGLVTGNPVAAVNVLGASYSSNDSSVSALVSALEEEGLIKVMAKPNLTALSGETASFLSGGEFPVPVGLEDGRISVEFREFGVSLAFTPTLINDNRISLRVRPEVSQLTNTGAFNNGDLVIPALSTRRAETTVEMGSGQSFAIAGLLQQRISTDGSSIPGLNEVPGGGTIFGSQNFDKQETELVIIVTPYVVEPTNAKLAMPGDGYKAPHDADRYINRAQYTKPKQKSLLKTGFDLN